MLNREAGQSGETLARKFLEEKGLAFRGANIRSPFGEIDLVMEDRNTAELVFIEVKARSGTGFGKPEESVTAQKRHKLRQLVAWYCQRSRWTGSVRLDVVGVLFHPSAEPDITHTTYVG